MAINYMLHRPTLVMIALLAGPLGQSAPPSEVPQSATQLPTELAPTVHAALPSNASELWLVPS